MGGTKKKSISQAEKAQAVTQKRGEKKGKDSKSFKRQKKEAVFPKLDETQVKSTLGPLKAITINSASRILNIKASTATVLLNSLESKGPIQKFGGYSGHYIYRLTEKA